MKLHFKQGKADKIHIHVDGEYKMTVDRDFIAASPYYENMEIDEQELAELENEVGSRRAFNKAVELLSRRDHATGELKEKLRQKGYVQGAEQALEKLCEYGYLDDRRFAESYAEELVRLKHFGKRRIEQELYKKGVARDIIKETLERIETDTDALEALVERKYARFLGTQKGNAKAVNALVRMGYPYADIKAAIESVCAKAEIEQSDEEF